MQTLIAIFGSRGIKYRMRLLWEALAPIIHTTIQMVAPILAPILSFFKSIARPEIKGTERMSCCSFKHSRKITFFRIAFCRNFRGFAPFIFRSENYPYRTTVFENPSFSQHSSASLAKVNYPKHEKPKIFPTQYWIFLVMINYGESSKKTNEGHSIDNSSDSENSSSEDEQDDANKEYDNVNKKNDDGNKENDEVNKENDNENEENNDDMYEKDTDNEKTDSSQLIDSLLQEVDGLQKALQRERVKYEKLLVEKENIKADLDRYKEKEEQEKNDNNDNETRMNMKTARD
ncbi:hypothetical protein TSAR_012211, partial [Trichomalopsis sarcophagae]